MKAIMWIIAAACAVAAAQPAEPGPVDQITKEAAAVRAHFTQPDVLAFLDAAAKLPTPHARTIWRSADRTRVVSDREYRALAPDQQAGLEKRDYAPGFFYTTGYGTPVLYARPLALAADAAGGIRGKRILDFGYGMIGQLRMEALLGCDVHGVEVEPVLRALYSEPGDTGPLGDGRVTLHHGKWPGEIGPAVGQGFDIFISKNVLKRGYVHPEREADPARLVHLGVDDAAFIKAMHDALKPGGIAVIYNIAPAQNPPDKPFLPHADGRCAFSRADLEAGGFEVIAYDADDSEAIRAMWTPLGLTQPGEDLTATLFAHATVLRRR